MAWRVRGWGFNTWYLLYTCTCETKKEVSKSIRTVWFKTLKIIFAQLQYTNTCNQEKFHNAPLQMRTQIRILDASKLWSSSLWIKLVFHKRFYRHNLLWTFLLSGSFNIRTYLHHVLNASFAFRIAFHLFWFLIGPPSRGTESAMENVHMRNPLFIIQLVKTSDKTDY